MQITFMGAAQTVTGSCYIIEALGKRFAVDCGMHQGSKDIDNLNRNTAPYKPKQLDFIILTHAHIDHSGLLPRMVKYGFKGDIFCTAPTADLLNPMLKDSAHIQEMESEWANKKNKRHGTKKNPLEPLYSMEDALKTILLLKKVDYSAILEPVDGLKIKYLDAGHILGSSIVEIEITEDGKVTKLAFSGDLGRPKALLLEDHQYLTTAPDYLFIETTYGDRDHKNEDDTLNELAEAIDYSYKRSGKVLIPSFAVERTQEILYSLYLLKKQNKLPTDMPVFVDSPLAIEATKIFSKYSNFLDLGDAKDFKTIETALGVQYTLSVQESMALNASKNPSVILSASGMCNAGRIKHHLKNSAYLESTSIVFVGYQAVGTPGRSIVEGKRNITMLGEPLEIKGKIFTIGGFSAHAGQSQLLDWIKKSPHTDETQVVLIHGEQKAQEIFAEKVKQQFGLGIIIPKSGETLTLESGKVKEVQKCPDYTPQNALYDFDYMFEMLQLDMRFLESRLEKASDKSPKEQEEIYNKLLQTHEAFNKLLQFK